eukprot:4550559-Prymnesium_polylepis.1
MPKQPRARRTKSCSGVGQCAYDELQQRDRIAHSPAAVMRGELVRCGKRACYSLQQHDRITWARIGSHGLASGHMGSHR